MTVTPITLTFEERGATLSGSVSDEIAIFFMSWLFDDKERELYAAGKRTEAASSLVKRREEALKLQTEDEFGEIVLNKFFHEYSHKTETRLSIIGRLTEIFDFPPEMIARRNDGSYKICLELREIAEIVFGIVGALPEIKEAIAKKRAESEIQTDHLSKEEIANVAKEIRSYLPPQKPENWIESRMSQEYIAKLKELMEDAEGNPVKLNIAEQIQSYSPMQESKEPEIIKTAEEKIAELQKQIEAMQKEIATR